MKLKGQVAIVTGAGAGIGRASALLFAAEGATIAVVDRDPETGHATVEDIRKQGGQAAFYQVDVAEVTPLEECIAQVIRDHGSVDLLYNNAGIVPEGDIETATIEEYDRAMNINVRAAFVASRAVIPHMKEKRAGCILITASVGGMRALNDRAIYCISKGAVISLTTYLAKEYAPWNIRANCVSPASVDTPSLQKRFDDAPDPAAKRAFFLSRQPLGRMAAPEEIARAALYLATEPFVTGTNLVIDGGFMA